MPSFRQLCNLDKIYDGMILRHIHSTELPTLIGGSWAICEKNICLVMSDNIIKLLNIGGGGDRSHVFSLQNLTLTKGRFCDCQWKSSTFCGLCETNSLASSVTLTCDHIDLKPITHRQWSYEKHPACLWYERINQFNRTQVWCRGCWLTNELDFCVCVLFNMIKSFFIKLDGSWWVAYIKNAVYKKARIYVSN